MIEGSKKRNSTMKYEIDVLKHEVARLYETKEMDSQLILELTKRVNELSIKCEVYRELIGGLKETSSTVAEAVELKKTADESTLKETALELKRKHRREYAKKYRKENPEKVKEADARYWERKAQKQKVNGESND